MTLVRSHLRRLVILLAVAGFGATARPAVAQLLGNIPNPANPASLGSGPPDIGGPPPAAKKAPATPPALPGTVPRADRVAPSQGTTIGDPTEALFDAINRGDIASARDAIDRGADLGGHSILGMTPLDLSVDLGRNDITFLLLSMTNGDPRSRTAGTAKVGHGAGAAPTGGKLAATTPPKTTAKPPVRSAAPAHAATTPVAQQYAGDSGAPDPAAGFLGFGPSR